jgi:hypothetical protein
MACLTLTNPTKRCKGAGEQCPDESLGLTSSGSFSVKPSLWLLVSSHSYRLAIRHTQKEKIAALISIDYLRLLTSSLHRDRALTKFHFSTCRSSAWG